MTRVTKWYKNNTRINEISKTSLHQMKNLDWELIVSFQVFRTEELRNYTKKNMEQKQNTNNLFYLKFSNKSNKNPTLLVHFGTLACLYLFFGLLLKYINLYYFAYQILRVYIKYIHIGVFIVNRENNGLKYTFRLRDIKQKIKHKG